MRWTYEVYFVRNPIAHSIVRSMARNLAEFWYDRLGSNDAVLGVHLVDTHDDALKAINSSQAKFAMVATLGNNFQGNGEFLDVVDETIAEDTFVLGHILDRNERYYELHEQCFVINVQLCKQHRPRYLPKRGEKPAVSRSSDNLHRNNYTPLWIRPGEGSLRVNDPAPGADIIATGIENNLNLVVLTEQQRNAKLYIYPEKPLAETHLSHLLKEAIERKSAHYAFNNEPVPDVKAIGPLDFIAHPCAGFNLFVYLREAGMAPGISIRVFDSNPISLEIYRALFSSWNGSGYKVLFEHYGNLVRKSNDRRWSQFVTGFGGQAQWQNFFAKVRDQDVRVVEFDLMDPKGKHRWHNGKVDGNGLFVASNVFAYMRSSVFYSRTHRAAMYQRLLDNLPPQTWIHAQFPLRQRDDPLMQVNQDRLQPVRQLW